MSRGRIVIAIEMIREVFDLPDAIRITGIRDALPWRPGPPTEFVVEIESDHELHAEFVMPVYRRYYDESITRLELQEINGYQGPLEPRPSTRRKS